MTEERRPRGVTYRSYNFIDKDPIIDELRTLIGNLGHGAMKQIERDSGVTTFTLRNWFHGATKRPQHATVKAVLRAIGHDLAVVDMTAARSSPSPSPSSSPSPSPSPSRTRAKRLAPIKAWRPEARRARLRKAWGGK